MSARTRIISGGLVWLCSVGLICGPAKTASAQCTVPDNGSGTVTLPPQGCEYLSPDEVHMIIDGLPPGTTIEIAPIHQDFICGSGVQVPCTPAIPGFQCEGPGGALGGQHDCFRSQGSLELQGTGALAGFSRNIGLPIECQVNTAPRTPGQPVQSFDTDMFLMQGQITGDPDFDLLRIVAGTQNGMPSPGHTTLSNIGGGMWAVDSFFDITYRIDFVGAPGGPLAGLSGSTTGTIRMVAFGPGGGIVCCLPDGSCTITQTAAACGALGGFPMGPGTTCLGVVCPTPNQACCLPTGGCFETNLPSECSANGGTLQGPGTTCTPNLCPQPQCVPTPDGQACQQSACPNGALCQPTCILYDPNTGQSVVLACACRSTSECHAVIPGSGGGSGGGDPRGGGNPCVVNDNGGGTVALPPIGCEYLSPDDVHQIINGLPAGTTIEFAPIHRDFICGGGSAGNNPCTFVPPPGLCEAPGGSLGGQEDCFDSNAHFTLNGTGTLAGYNRIVDVPLACEVHTAPRTPGQPIQSFDTEMMALQGQITGDPDFDLLRITGGSSFGLPSPGHTTLTRLPSGQWAVDSFFDITYRIDFVGRAGGPLGGMSGSTTATIRMATGNAPICAGGCAAGFDCNETRFVQEDGTIIVCCDCQGTAPQCNPTPTGDACQPTICPIPGETCLPTCVNYDPNTGQTRVLSCDCRPDTECHAVNPNVPGAGGGGGDPRGGGNPCVVTDNGGGTVTLPPAGCQYLSPDEVHQIINGLPAGTTIIFAPIHKDFICGSDGAPQNVCSFAPPFPGVDCDQPGGSLGGEEECADSTLVMNLQGTGSLAGFNRNIDFALAFETHTAPRTPGNPVQSFDTDMFRMFGQIIGDPDFDLLRITGGTDFGLPSPGHTTLTQLPGGNWAVDSFFDITYRIDFVGKPGGPLGGMSGSTTGTIRMSTGHGPACTGICPDGYACEELRTVHADGSIDVCCNCVPLTSDCVPTPTGDACQASVCVDPNEECLPTCVHYDPNSGLSRVISCDCRRLAECHAVMPGTGGGSGGGGGNPCVVTDNGGGTVTLPPAGCEYLSPDQVHEIIDGLPSGTTIELAAIHKDFICHSQEPGGGVCSFPPPFPGVDCDQPGGTLGGEQECADSSLELTLNGTGTLAGFNRNITLPISFETHVAPRTPGNPVQSFDTDMFRLFGQINGDPDFDLLRVTGGTDFGLPSPGHTTLTSIGGGNWAVDSFFDITYRIDFVGSPGGPLAGRSGSTTATIRMTTGIPPGPPPTCEGGCPLGTSCQQIISAEYADGSVDLCCVCVPTNEACCLPDGSCVDVPAIECAPVYGGTPQGPGSTCATANCQPLECGPNPTGQACNPAPCPNDGEECLPTCVLFNTITGQTTVISCDCRQPNDCHAVFTGTGTGGGEGGGGGGSNPCVVLDNGGGTVTLPPAGCQYLSPSDVHEIIDGLPAGTTIELAPIHKDFICRSQEPTGGVCSFPAPIPNVDCDDAGGSLGGEKECANSNLQLTLSGTGTLAGFTRTLVVPLEFETHTAPRTPGQPVQSFDTDMFRMFGQITGDPDFDLLRVVGGTDFGLPSPGHTTLTQQPGGSWAVDSFFDITYRIDFVGAPGGHVPGMSGSTTATIRMTAGVGGPPDCAGNCPPGTACRRTVVTNTDGTIIICCECVPVCDCPGDVYADGVLNGKDIQAFVDCLLGNPTPAVVNCACVDFDGNGPSMSDVPLFVQALLSKAPCPQAP